MGLKHSLKKVFREGLRMKRKAKVLSGGSSWLLQGSLMKPTELLHRETKT
ncbi:hypothetical protein BofuT4_uP086170.1 [Botrytis cinerea T4]|uniref:Uncharacterized protein n=1 Tax=Botryotinia fuckeliana (strain T4) TaxID=999810 RepID=G2YGE0_BOTF4|nr:hypothetical protein BofuT4_uP086170.1 [Botrytis cinerea T4]